MKEIVFRKGNDVIKATEDTTIDISANTAVEFNISDLGYVYGYGFNATIPYPLNSAELKNEAFCVSNIQSPIWICSNGAVIFANTNDMLSVSFNCENDGKLIISCCNGFPLRLYLGQTATQAHKKLFSSFNINRSLINDCFIGDSVFCTWTQYPRCINQERIISFAKEIRKNEYPCSVIIIDDIWENNYGNLKFADSFPDPKAMISELHAMGFKVILWITPFVNTDSDNFEFLEKNEFLVMKKDSDEAALLTWWGGIAGLIDLSNPKANKWYTDTLLKLKDDYGADGFKIDGGDAKFQPSPEQSRWYNYCGASGYTDLLLSAVEAAVPGMCETRTAWISQARNIVWRQGGKDTHWGENNGLKALVNYGLYMSLLGYDFFIPDMVGGRMHTVRPSDPNMTDELFIRYAESSALMPSLQFSYFPWNYGEQTKKAVHTCALLHKALESYVRELCEDTSEPIIRPIWYNDENNGDLYTVKGEFMLGNDLLAAPILDSGVKEKTVVLPTGVWLDIYSGAEAEGEITVPVKCPMIPLYVRKGNEKLYKAIAAVMEGYTEADIAQDQVSATYKAGVDRSNAKTG